MTYAEFCNKIQSGDRIIVAISLAFSHHAIFWGWDANGQGWIIENHKDNGVQYITIEDFFAGLTGNVQLIPFVGSQEERHQAILRAMNSVGQKYHLWQWNCEQFANYVQHNKVESLQVRNTTLVGIGLLLWFGGRS